MTVSDTGGGGENCLDKDFGRLIILCFVGVVDELLFTKLINF